MAACGNDSDEPGDGGSGGSGGSGGTGGEVEQPECVRDADCDDRNPCTIDACEVDTCVHRPLSAADLDDNNACTEDVCDPELGVLHLPIDPDDGNACTVDSCDPDIGVVNRPLTPEDYDDRDPCTIDACDPEIGVTHTLPDMSDGDPCTIDYCDRATGEIRHDPVDMDDGDACTDDVCDPLTGLVTHVPKEIDDGNLCTIDSCNPQTGQITHLAVTIDDGNPCTIDACDPETGIITNTQVDINDGNHCTIDTCNPLTGEIKHVLAPVDDQNACTIDSCDPATGMVINELIPMSDGNLCTLDLCDPETGEITHPPLPEIDDGNPCTFDYCDPQVGLESITHRTEDLPGWDDGNLCTIEQCVVVGQSFRIDRTNKPVDDGDACTIDSCDPTTGVVSNVPIDPSEYDDNDPCTIDTCDPVLGRVHTPVVYDDGNACTLDSCDPVTGEGVFVALDPSEYDDGDPCTIDTCDPDVGPVHTPVVYDDGNACTIDSCDPETGEAVYTPVDPSTYDDGNACTIDSCDPETGEAVHVAVDPSTYDDGNPCTLDSCDPETGEAVHVPVECMTLEVIGLDALLAGHRGAAELFATMPADYPADSHLRWEVVLLDADGNGVAGAKAFYFGGEEGEIEDDPSTWTTFFETDDTGWGHFGWPDGFLADTTTLKDPGGETTAFQVLIPNPGTYELLVTLNDLTLGQKVDDATFEVTVAPVSSAASITYGGPATAAAYTRTETSVTASLHPSYPAANAVRWRITVTRNGLPAASEVIYYSEDPAVTDHELFTDSFSTDENGVTWFGPGAGMPAALLQGEPITTLFSISSVPGVYETLVELVDFSAGDAVIGALAYTITVVGPAETTFTAPDTVEAGVRIPLTVTAALDSAYPATNRVLWKVTILKNGLPAADETIFYTEDAEVTDHELFTDSFSTDENGVTWFGPASGMPASHLQGEPISTLLSFAGTEGAYVAILELVDLDEGNKVIGSSLFELAVTAP